LRGLSVFGLGGFLGSEWEERKIKEIIDKTTLALGSFGLIGMRD
jgi:hypothetical protein